MNIKLSAALFGAVIAISAVPVGNCEVVKSNEFRLPLVSASGARSAMLALPDGTVLAFVVNTRAEWGLYRVHNWLDGKPLWDSISVSPTFSLAARRNLRELRPRLLNTADNRFILCVAEAGFYETRFLRVRNASTDTVITVVDLATFKPVAQVKLSSLDAASFFVRHIDQEDHLLIEQDKDVGGIPTSAAFLRLSIPSLTPGPKCEFRWVMDARGTGLRPSAHSEGCKTAMPESVTLETYLREPKPKLVHELPACKANPAIFCRSGLVASITADGAFAVSEYIAGRDAFPIGYTWTYHSYLVFSCQHRSDAGEIKVSPHVDVDAVLATQNGNDYLLIIEDGSRFTAYELRV